MHCKKVLLLVGVTMASLFLCAQKRSYSSEVYFTPYDIKEQILRAIQESKETIDIAVLNITSGDILKSLFQARERGVTIRIVVDGRRALTREPLLTIFKDKKLTIRAFNRRGMLHSNFAIFDSKLLATGSYYWIEKVNKFNRDNIIFTDEAKILVKCQKEFEHIFSESVTPNIPETVSTAEDTLPAIVRKPLPPGRRVIASNYGVAISENADGYIDMGFEEFNTIFGVVSDLSEEQRNALWNRCTGKRVKWTGRVNYIGWGLITGWMMSVTHEDTGVEIKLDPANKAHFSKVKYGNTVTYSGKLDSIVTKIFPYKLVDGDVLDITDTPPRPLSIQELTENVDITPISQGPKKIFITESFEDLDTIFGDKSNLTDNQKEDVWKRYEGKYVSWIGQIIYKNLTAASGLRMRMEQENKKYVEVKIGSSKKNKILKFQDGETILYTGRLSARCKDTDPYILEDGDIMAIK